MKEDYPRTLLELERRFCTEQACRKYLFDPRWPDGFRCPRCEAGKSWALQSVSCLVRTFVRVHIKSLEHVALQNALMCHSAARNGDWIGYASAFGARREARYRSRGETAAPIASLA